MAGTTLMATSRFCSASFQPEQAAKGAYKDIQTVKIADGSVFEIPRSGLHLRSDQLDVYKDLRTLPSEFNQQVSQPPLICSSRLFSIPDGSPDSVLLSFTISEHYERYKKKLHLLASESVVLDGGGLNFSIPSDSMVFHTPSIDVKSPLTSDMDKSSLFYKHGDDSNAPFLYPQKEIYSPKVLMGLVPEFSLDALTMMYPNGHALFTGTETEMKHLLAMVTKFYLTKKNRSGMQRREMVVPYFRRSGRKARGSNHGQLNLHLLTNPAKSTEDINLGLPQKKKQKKFGHEKSVCRNNYSHICESLLSVLLVKNPNKFAFVSLKRNSHGLFQLLTQFSAGIAGTGLAVLFSVIWKLGYVKVPFCTTRLLNTGFALGLLWLSSSINSLRDTILETSKNMGHMRLKEDEIMTKLETSVKEVFVRVATVMAIAIVRLA